MPKFESPSLDTIHIWLADLNQPIPTYQQLLAFLSAKEIIKARSYYRDREKRQFVTRHGILRSILSQYYNSAPDQIDFCYSPRGKPALRRYGPQPELFFNISFSGDIALFGFCRCSPIGVDVELIKAMPDQNQIVDRFFSSSDMACYYRLPKGSRTQAFYAYWTRKEAFVKAIGEGLNYPLNTFDVAHAPDEATGYIRTVKRNDGTSCWVIRNLNIVPGYAAAFAVQEKSWTLCIRHWTDNTDYDR